MTLRQGGARQTRRERPQAATCSRARRRIVRPSEATAAAAAANISCHVSAPAFGFRRTDKLNTQAGKHAVATKLQHPWNRRSVLVVGILLRQQNGHHKYNPVERSVFFLSFLCDSNGVNMLYTFLGGGRHYYLKFIYLP